MSATRLASIRVPGDGEPWAALGFIVIDDAIGFANGAIRVGATASSFDVEGTQPSSPDLEGIPIGLGDRVAPARHANGATELDHVVIMTDSLERTSTAIESVLGLEQRRVRETEVVRQGFHRFADTDRARGCIVEVVETDRVDRTAIWGIVLVVDDLDDAVAGANGLIGAAKDAVQPGRRIATVSRAAGLPIAVALMSR